MPTYAELTPRQSTLAADGFMARAIPLMPLERFCDTKPFPGNTAKSMTFRRYFVAGGAGSYSGEAGAYAMPYNVTALTEGVTPAKIEIDYHDVEVDLEQYGTWTDFTDQMLETHPDAPAMLREFEDALGEHAALSKEKLLFSLMVSGTNVFYAGTASARNQVIDKVSVPMLRRVQRALANQNIQPITRMLAATTGYDTTPVAAAYICYIHPNVENDLRALDGFIPVEKYQQSAVMDGEVGKFEKIRFIATTVASSWDNAGASGAVAAGVLSQGGTKADVYPMIFMGKGAITLCPLRGTARAALPNGQMRGGQNMAVNMVMPKVTTDQPLGQIGIISYKFWHAACITNPFALQRGEVACSV